MHALDFGATRLVASWGAQTPPGTWLKTEMRARLTGGTTPWLCMGNYAFRDTDISRTSVSAPAEPFGVVDTDMFLTCAGHTLRAYQLRATLYRAPGSDLSPRVWQLGASASFVPCRATVLASKPGPASRRGIELAVPRYSQVVHAGRYPHYGGGGEAWCSPTATEMVCEYWGAFPSAEDLSWVSPGYQDPAVAHAARHTYDHSYGGTGNWPFNAAYAASFGLDAQIVQLPSMAELEELLAHGIPVITSQAFDAGEIAGACYRTAGHLWVVTGFTHEGDVIVNDPAALRVRCVLGRQEFENAWLRTYWRRQDGSAEYGTGGVAYLIKPSGLAFPPNLDPANPAW